MFTAKFCNSDFIQICSCNCLFQCDNLSFQWDNVLQRDPSAWFTSILPESAALGALKLQICKKTNSEAKSVGQNNPCQILLKHFKKQEDLLKCSSVLPKAVYSDSSGMSEALVPGLSWYKISASLLSCLQVQEVFLSEPLPWGCDDVPHAPGWVVCPQVPMSRSVLKSHTSSVLCIFLNFHLPVMLSWKWDQTAQDCNTSVGERGKYVLRQGLSVMIFTVLNVFGHYIAINKSHFCCLLSSALWIFDSSEIFTLRNWHPACRFLCDTCPVFTCG